MSYDSDDITKLNLSNVDLYGRSNELKILLESYQRICRDDDPENDEERRSSEIVLVKGKSGSGKSALVMKFRDRIQKQFRSNNNKNKKAFFVSGKFDSVQRNTPYFALIQAFSELCDKILALENGEAKDRLFADIKEAMGCEGKIITKMIPKLRDIIGEQGEFACIGMMEAQTKVTSLFRAFVRAVGTASHPLVLFLDDLQWADGASLNLMKALLTDEESKRLLLISAFRMGETMDSTQKYGTACVNLIQMKKIVNMTKIHVQNLDLPQVNDLLSDVLKMDQEHTQSLADVVHRKTQGNAFFVLKFLETLQMESLIQFSFSTLKWTWNAEDIRKRTAISDNVLDMELAKLKKLPEKHQSVLRMAACLGSQFDWGMLSIMLSSWQKDLLHTLENLVEEGFLDRGDDDRYKFSHDQIHLASYSLVPEGTKRQLLHLRIGELLWEHRDTYKGQEDHLLFVIADQLNRGSVHITNQEKKIDLASLNLQIAEKAIEAAAFMPAASYLRAGRDLLVGTDIWKTDYDLALKIHTKLASMEYCTGQFVKSSKMSEEVFNNARTLQDKIPSYFTMITLLISQEKFEKAFDLGYDVLLQLGENVSRNARMALVLKDLVKTKKMVKSRTDNELIMLPELKDETKLAALQILSHLIPCAMYLKKPEHVMMMCFRMIQVTLERGVSKFSAYGYAVFGMIVCGYRGDIKEGYRFGKLALSLLERFKAKEWKARVYYIVYSCIYHWKNPVQDCLDRLLEAYEAGIASGDITDAMMSAKAYCSYYVLSGLPLEPVQNDIRAFCAEMEQYGQIAALHVSLPLWQFMLNLMGRSEDPLKLQGEALTEKDELATQKTNNGFAQCISSFMRMELYYTFGEYDLAHQMLHGIKEHMKHLASHYVVCRIVFREGLVAIALAKKTKKRKWKVEARRVIVQMEKWAEDAAGNCLHMLHLLKAEYASLDGNGDSAKKAYDRAISTTSRTGFTQDRALANELAGLFFRQQGDSYWASYYLTNAFQLYDEWGARAKADHLLEHNKAFIEKPERSSHRGRKGHLGRSRFDSVHVSTDSSSFSSGSSTSLLSTPTGSIVSSDESFSSIDVFEQTNIVY